MRNWQRNWKQSFKSLALTPRNLDRILVLSWAVAIIAVASILTACSSFETRPTLPTNLATKCPDATVFEGQTLGDLMVYTVDLLGQYKECQTKMQTVYDWSNSA
jgi:hypothetical protein